MRKVRLWDKAATQDGGKRTAGVLMFEMDLRAGYSFMVANVVKGRWDSGKREQIIQTVADQNGRPVEIG
ncbi:MAG: hypothetical protein PVG84_14955 [Desulfobacterales bacterium]